MSETYPIYSQVWGGYGLVGMGPSTSNTSVCIANTAR